MAIIVNNVGVQGEVGQPSDRLERVGILDLIRRCQEISLRIANELGSRRGSECLTLGKLNGTLLDGGRTLLLVSGLIRIRISCQPLEAVQSQQNSPNSSPLI